MSLLQQVAASIDTASEDLPLPEVRLAAERLRLASGLLGFVLSASVAIPVGRAPALALGRAAEHLDTAAATLHRARESLAGYLAAIGLRAIGPGGAPIRENRDWRHALTSAAPALAGSAAPAGGRSNWWADRIGALTQEGPGSAAEEATTSPVLLERAVARALAGDRAGLHRELAGATPAVGLGLAAITPAVLGQLAAELAGHPVGPDDVPTLTRAVRPATRRLLPGLPEPVLGALIARLCRAPVPAVQAHPGDGAAAGVVFVAGLLHALHRDARCLTLEAYHAPRPLVARA